MGVLANFSDALEEGDELAGLIADLGYSSDQLEDPARGLSFMTDGPLDMRLDPSDGMSARDWLQKAKQTEIETVLRDYGEERFAGRIARRIVERRLAGELPSTTLELAQLIESSVPGKRGKIHPATRSFQAIRIRVNDELGELETLLDRATLGLKVGGRLGIISFHSLEDRIVKRRLGDRVSLGTFNWLSKKPILPSEEEVAENSRSRSAKLRIAEKKGER
jgi:16S rRNA (cytosine1402-N4)-methyltransferase